MPPCRRSRSASMTRTRWPAKFRAPANFEQAFERGLGRDHQHQKGQQDCERERERERQRQRERERQQKAFKSASGTRSPTIPSPSRSPEPARRGKDLSESPKWRRRLRQMPSSPQHVVSRQQAKVVGRFNVKCSFMCNGSSESPCPLCTKDVVTGNIARIQWARNRLRNGGVDDAENDWFCERTFIALWKHKYTRKGLQNTMAADKSLHDKLLEDRQQFIDRLKAGASSRNYWQGRLADSSRVEVSTREATQDRQTDTKRKRERARETIVVLTRESIQERIIMPKSQFWPLKLYKHKFGDPKAKPAPRPVPPSCHRRFAVLLFLLIMAGGPSCYFC